MRTCSVENLTRGEIGLVDPNGRSLAFAVGDQQGNAQTLVLSTENLRPSARSEVYCLLLAPSEARNWPAAIAFDDAEMSPDISSLTCGFEIPERALVPASEGGLRLAVRANGWSLALFDAATSELSDFSPSRSSWYFTKWAVTIPSPTHHGIREAIFSVEI